MKIKRIDSYEDCRFSKAARMQHGCFLVENDPYEIEIISKSEAIVRGADSRLFSKVIDEFRFYAPQISCFYNQQKKIIKEFEQKHIFKIEMADIQPSQFYVDKDKLAAVGGFIHEPEDIIIQVLPFKDRYISLDGHTRLYYAVMKGWNRIYAIEEKSDESVYAFVNEARKRNICTPMDMMLVSHEDYEKKWNGFCDEFFAQEEGATNEN